ncbi:MAG: hypothetical protein ACOY4Q_00790 [Bacillota bacterium]
MQISKRTFAVWVIGLFWGIIGLSMVTGVWESKVPAEAIVVESAADIKGWMKLEEVAHRLSIPYPELVKLLEIPDSVSPETQIKELAALKGVETDEFREKIDAYLKTKTVSTPDSVYTVETAEESESVAKSPAEQPAVQEPVKPDTARSVTNNVEPEPKSTSETTAGPGAGIGAGDQDGTPEEIRGRMTFKEVSVVTGVPVGYIFSQLGIPASENPDTVMRDVTEKYGFEVDQVRDIVAGYKK